MSVKFDQVRVANNTIQRDLAFLRRVIEVFSMVFELDVPTRAKRVTSQLRKVTDLYFHETWDSSEVITSSLDLTFSELEYETDEFAERVRQLNRSISELRRIYEQFVLSQALVMLVSSLEVYFSTVFRACLSDRLDLNESAILKIVSQFNFQNWGSTVNAYRTFLEIELCPQTVDGAKIDALLQKRHVLVHRMGVVDERAIHQLKLPSSLLGTRLKIEAPEIAKSIDLVYQIVEHLSSTLEK